MILRAALAPAALLAAVSFATCPGLALAADDAKAAKAHYETGTRLYAIGDFTKAVEEFKAAYLARPDAAFLFNIGQSQRMLGDCSAAVTSYKSYLRGKPGAPNRKDVDGFVGECEKKMADAAARPAPPPPKKVERHSPLPFVEPASKHAFPTWTVVDDKEYSLLGVGARSVLGFRVYAMALYVEDGPARAAFPKLAGKAGGADSKTLLASKLVAPFIVEGDFGKRALLWFTRDVSARQQRESYKDALGADVGDKASPEVRRDAEAFLALFDRDLKTGDEMEIRTDAEGRIGVAMAGAPIKWGPKSLRVMHDIWDIWLGDKPISGDLKGALLQRIDTLGN